VSVASAGLGGARNNINLSSQTLHDLLANSQQSRLPDCLRKQFVLRSSGKTRRDAERLLRRRAAKPAGCCFTIARFEGVQGSFELLKALGPDFVKISPRVVRNIDQVLSSAATAEAIHRKCRSLGIRTIAEHVESDQVLVQLRRMGVTTRRDSGPASAITA
jgi:EAL domain-containing protein (putative c-di-GMP-specific phosphodiesterase class I)